MPSEDYAPAVRGGLKLKGGAPTGVTKKKKKKKKKQNASKDDEAARENAIRQALEEEDAEAQNRQKSEDTGLGEADLRELESRGEDGKTASERQFEEVRRKRVSALLLHSAYEHMISQSGG